MVIKDDNRVVSNCIKKQDIVIGTQYLGKISDKINRGEYLRFSKCVGGDVFYYFITVDDFCAKNTINFENLKIID